MPSPVGHALGGIAAGWLLEPEHTRTTMSRTGQHVATLGLAALGIAADLDLVVGAHRGASHSLGAVAFVALVSWCLIGARPGRGRWTAAIAAAYGSHLLLDWLGSDTSAPFGIPALWPLTSTYYQAPWPLFSAVSRRIHQPELFWMPNARALAREVLILLPIVVLVGYKVRRGRGRLRNRAVAAAIAMVGMSPAAEHLSARQAPGLPQPGPPRVFVEDAPQGSAYVQAVVRYLAGDFENAVTALRALPESEVRSQERNLQKEPRWIQAAVMAHTEAASAPGIEDRAQQFHFLRARQLIGELRRIQSPGEFQRAWYLLASALLQAEKSVNDAEDLLGEARGIFHQDPELLVSTGTAFELRTFITAGVLAQQPVPSAVRTPDTDLRRDLQSAVRYLSEAAKMASESPASAPEISPVIDEAHLRLGRVLHRLGQTDRAVEELDVVRRRAADMSFKYLAALFEASVESTRRRPRRATELYLEALATFQAQSALVGLSHAYYEQGQDQEAARVLQTVFRLSSKQPDPWFAYLLGDAWHAARRLKAMRALVTQPPVAQPPVQR
jgi:inner membrane protein